MFGLASFLYCLKLETLGTRNKIQCDFKYAEIDHLDLDNQMENTLTLSTVKSECYQKPSIDETQKTMVNRKKDMVKHNSKILNTKNNRSFVFSVYSGFPHHQADRHDITELL